MAKNIKYFNIILIAVLAVFLLCSCNKDNNSDDSFDSNTTENIVSDTETDTDTDTIADSATDSAETEDTDAAETTAEGYEIITVNGERFAVIPYDGEKYDGSVTSFDPDRIRPMYVEPVNDSSKIDKLVEKYLSTGEGYDELLNVIYYRYVSDNTIMCSSATAGFEYYSDVDTDKIPGTLLIMLDDEGNLTADEYYVAKYGDITKYKKYEEYINLHFSSDIASGHLKAFVLNVNGYMFVHNASRSDSHVGGDPEYSLLVDEEIIVLCEKRTVYENNEPTDEYEYEYSVLKKYSHRYNNTFIDVWKWADINCCSDVYYEYMSDTAVLK